MTPKNWKKNVYEFKEEYIVLRVYNGDIEYKCFIDYGDYKRVRERHWYIVYYRTVSRPYLQARIKDKKVLIHRYILNTQKHLQVDHKNHNPLDNRRSNLKECSQQENLLNRRPKRGYGRILIPNISIVTTYYKSKKYEYYKVDKKGIPIKTFKKLEDAIKYKESHEIQT